MIRECFINCQSHRHKLSFSITCGKLQWRKVRFKDDVKGAKQWDWTGDAMYMASLFFVLCCSMFFVHGLPFNVPTEWMSINRGTTQLLRKLENKTLKNFPQTLCSQQIDVGVVRKRWWIVYCKNENVGGSRLTKTGKSDKHGDTFI